MKIVKANKDGVMSFDAADAGREIIVLEDSALVCGSAHFREMTSEDVARLWDNFINHGVTFISDVTFDGKPFKEDSEDKR